MFMLTIWWTLSGTQKCGTSYAPGCFWVTFNWKSSIPIINAGDLTYVSLDTSESALIQTSTSPKLPIFKVYGFPKHAKALHDIALCIQPIYLFADWLALVQFLEIWRSLGATWFYMYLVSITKLVNQLTLVYERENIIGACQIWHHWTISTDQFWD